MFKNKMARLRAVQATAMGLVLTAAASAHAQTGPWDAFFDAVDFDGVSAKVIAGGLLIIGIAVAFKGPDLAKRLVRKA